jgi:chromosome segregation protein
MRANDTLARKNGELQKSLETNIAELEDSLKKKNEEIRDLEGKLVEFQRTLEKKQDEFRGDLDMKTAEIQKLEGKVDELRGALHKKEADLDTAGTREADLNKKNDEFQRTLHMRTAEIQKLEGKLDELRGALHKKEADLDAAGAKEADLENTIRDLRLKPAEATEEECHWKADQASAYARIQELSDKLQVTKLKKKKLKMDTKALNEEASIKSTEYQALMEKVKDSTEELQPASKNLENERANVKELESIGDGSGLQVYKKELELEEVKIETAQYSKRKVKLEQMLSRKWTGSGSAESLTFTRTREYTHSVVDAPLDELEEPVMGDEDNNRKMQKRRYRKKYRN